MEQLSESQKQVSKLIEQLSGKDVQTNNLIEIINNRLKIKIQENLQVTILLLIFAV